MGMSCLDCADASCEHAGQDRGACEDHTALVREREAQAALPKFPSAAYVADVELRLERLEHWQNEVTAFFLRLAEGRE